MRKLFTILAVVMALVVGLVVQGYSLAHPYNPNEPTGGGTIDDHPWGGDDNGGGGTTGTPSDRPRYIAATGNWALDFFFSRFVIHRFGYSATKNQGTVRDVSTTRFQDSANSSTPNGAE